MSVWYAIPSKRPPDEAEKVLKLWRERGYEIALQRDDSDAWEMTAFPYAVVTLRKYRGYAEAVNFLVRLILKEDPQAEWIITGGDDVEPDPNHFAEQIAENCNYHFGSRRSAIISGDCDDRGYVPQTHTFGVMQPTGDRWGENAVPGLQGAYIDRVCGSPWMGREFCRRMYQGNGPLFSGYRHMFEDEELQNVALKLGVLWQRPDLTHHHRHWGRKRGATMADCPEFLREVNSGKHWAESRALFETRKAGGFPGHEPLP